MSPRAAPQTCNFDVMHSLVTCPAHDFQFDLRNNLVPHRNVLGALSTEIAMFAVCQKEQSRGLDLAIELARQRMARYNVRYATPDPLPLNSLMMELGA